MDIHEKLQNINIEGKIKYNIYEDDLLISSTVSNLVVNRSKDMILASIIGLSYFNIYNLLVSDTGATISVTTEKSDFTGNNLVLNNLTRIPENVLSQTSVDIPFYISKTQFNGYYIKNLGLVNGDGTLLFSAVLLGTPFTLKTSNIYINGTWTLTLT